MLSISAIGDRRIYREAAPAQSSTDLVVILVNRLFLFPVNESGRR